MDSELNTMWKYPIKARWNFQMLKVYMFSIKGMLCAGIENSAFADDV